MSTDTTLAPAPEAPVEALIEAATETPALDDLVEDELLVEEISIDGMCGVY